jgi:hypothetical protein
VTDEESASAVNKRTSRFLSHRGGIGMTGGET